MAKLNSRTTYAPRAPRGAVRTTDDTTVTYEGGPAFKRDSKSELFMLGVSYLAGEDTFYESAGHREDRWRDLIHRVTADDPQWVADFLAWLRGPEANIRTAALIGAVEYGRAMGPNPRKVIASVCQRADEPGEIIAYVRSRHGKRFAGGIQRGVADAAAKLFNQYSAQKYDGKGANEFRLGDVIELAHPTPKDDTQRALFQYLLDRRHHSTDLRVDLGALPMISLARTLETIPTDERRAYLKAHPDVLKEAGKTWEWLSGWIPGGMDKDAWEAILGADATGMNYMALIRNLRNFTDAKVSTEILDKVIARLKDPEEVAKSRQFPFRFYSAYENTAIDFAPALEKAIDASTLNIPDLSGTLIVIDTSSSMTTGRVSKHSQMTPLDCAALAAMAVYKRSDNCEVVIFGDSWAKVSGLTRNTGVLRGVKLVNSLVGSVGHYSNGQGAVAAFFDPSKHKRAFMFSDGALSDHHDLTHVPSLYQFTIGGYGAAHQKFGEAGRHEIGGFTDSTFKMINLIERGRDSAWPWS